MSTATSTDIAVDIAVDSTYSKHDPNFQQMVLFYDVMMLVLGISVALYVQQFEVNLKSGNSDEQ